MSNKEHRESRFQTTAWTILENASGRGMETNRNLERLCNAYRYPVYAFIRNRCGDEEQARDHTQAFFAELFLGKRIFRQASRENGRFRTFLLACVKNFVNEQYRASQTQKRGGAVAHVPLDNLEVRYLEENVEGREPGELLDRAWARTVFTRVWSVVEKEYAEPEKEKQFKVLRKLIMGDTGQSYAGGAAELGMSEGGLKKAAHRLRGRFREVLRREIARVVEHPGEVDEEISYLIRMLG